MARKILFTISLIVVLPWLWMLTGCSRLPYRYDVVPDAASVYYSMAIKVNVRYKDSGQRDNFKILLKYDNSKDRMLFLSPLNQVYGLLVVDPDREDVLLVNTRKKKYWTGPFYLLLQEIWGPGMDFDYNEFKGLLVAGVVPADRLKRRDIKITIEKTSANDGETGKPERLTIDAPEVRVRIKVSNRGTGRGRIRFEMDLGRLEVAGIRELLE
jgi:hypothetical protein